MLPSKQEFSGAFYRHSRPLGRFVRPVELRIEKYSTRERPDRAPLTNPSFILFPLFIISRSLTIISIMSYRAFKKLLGETSLERKCRFLFGAGIIFLITLSFWLYAYHTNAWPTTRL